MKLSTLILTASLGLATAPSAWATMVLASNLGRSIAGPDPVFGPNWAAARFNTDAQAYSLNSVVLWAASAGPGSAAMAALYSDKGGTEPNAFLGSLTSSGPLPPVPGAAFFTASGITLNPSSAYWIVLKGIGPGVNWFYTVDNTGIGAGFDTHYALSFNDGSTWDAAAPSDPMIMQVHVDPVPEPSQWAMMAVTALGAGGFALRQWRSRKV